MPHAEVMESAALAAQDQLSGNQIEVRGVVRLGVPEVLGVRVITPLLAPTCRTIRTCRSTCWCSRASPTWPTARPILASRSMRPTPGATW
jgi:hypothetical protein